MDVGSFVKLANLPPSRAATSGIGRVYAYEEYRDVHGTRYWWYVQWLTEDGIPTTGTDKFGETELEVVDE